MHVQEFDHIVLNVADVGRSLGWYMERLGLDGVRVEEWRAGEAPFPSVRVTADTIIDLIEGERGGENLNHFCLVVDAADLDEVRASGEFDVVRDNPDQRLYGARGLATGIYIRDPDGNMIELRSY
ncbi:MAG TPA: VOC family protein [Dehalococcoidia bacterium]|nr:VOC family protein [Dehalococcoidia bacterium]